jgi:phage terminase small subunit
MSKLTIKQNKFCEVYVNTSSPSKAYKAAYDVSPTTQMNVISVKASELLQNGNVKVRIQELKQEVAARNYITRQDIAEGYLEIINAWKGLMNLASKDKLSKEQKQKFYLLKEMVKGSDYRGAFDSLAKMFGLNEPDKIDINQKIVNISINLND